MWGKLAHREFDGIARQIKPHLPDKLMVGVRHAERRQVQLHRLRAFV